MISDRLAQCLDFLFEIEKLKIVYRQNHVLDGSRQENSAEHSWHIALMAVVLVEYSDFQNMDLLKIIKMLLLHDVVEIHAGDTFLYDEKANELKDKNEALAADLIFGLLPVNLKDEFLSLWREFEARKTPESIFAASLDGLQPLMNHLATKGAGIANRNISTSRVIASKKHIADGSAVLWEYAQDVIQQSETAGLYKK